MLKLVNQQKLRDSVYKMGKHLENLAASCSICCKILKVYVGIFFRYLRENEVCAVQQGQYDLAVVIVFSRYFKIKKFSNCSFQNRFFKVLNFINFKSFFLKLPESHERNGFLHFFIFCTSHPLICIHTCGGSGVGRGVWRNVSFSENLACFVFLVTSVLRFTFLPSYRLFHIWF